MKNKSLIGNGFIWMSTSIFAVILPTVLAYLFELISQDELPNIYNYFDSILLIIFSISCSLFAICFDNRSSSLNKRFVEIVKIISSVVAIIFGSYHFYIIGIDVFKINNIFLIFSMFTLIILSILGWIISHHHNLYEDTIKSETDNINNEKMNKKYEKKD